MMNCSKIMTSIEEKKRLAQEKIKTMIKPNPPEVNGKASAEHPKQEESTSSTAEKFETVADPKENMLIKPSSFDLRPVYSRVDINCDKWLLTMDEESRKKLENPPSLADGLDRETEAELRFLGCELIQEGAILLRLPQTAAATAQILFQRYYFQKSFVKQMFEHVVMACLLLASKIEEAPRRPREVYNVFDRLEQLHALQRRGRPINKETTARLKPRPLDIKYVNAKNNIIKAERRLMATLGFVVHVKHPHKLICSYIFLLNLSERVDLTQKAWSYMNDGLRTDLFLRYTPETIACACIFLAARTVEPAIALPTSPFHWFELFDASDRDVQAIALMLQNMYARKKAPDMARLIAVLDKLREEQALAEKTKLAKLKAEQLTEKNGREKSEAKDNKDDKDSRRRRERSPLAPRNRTRSKSRTRSPRRDRRMSPVRRGRDSQTSRDADRRRREGNGGSRRRERDDDRQRRRSRSRERERDAKIRERSKLKEREAKEVFQQLGKRYRRGSLSPSPPPKTRK